MTQPNAILMFAAGLGTRMGALTATRPKSLVKVAGRALFDHANALTQVPQIRRRVVNLHYKADMMRAHLAGANIAISDEVDLLRDTGGGLRHALPLLGKGPVITLNTDAIWKGANPIPQILNAWDPSMEALLMMVPKEAVHGHTGPGDFQMDATGELTRGPGDIYTGLQIIRPDVLDEIEDTVFSLNAAWNIIAQRGGLYGCRYDGQWCDVGRPESIPLAEALLDV